MSETGERAPRPRIVSSSHDHDHDTRKRYVYKVIDSPVGRLTLVASDDGPGRHPLAERAPRPRAAAQADAEDGRHPVLVETERQLQRVLRGRRQAFALTLDVAGTAFQKQVWNALLTIPFGETRSYGEIARQIGRPTAARAVGAANGQNPVSIVAPCHRVDRFDGHAHGVCRRPRRQGAAAGARRRALVPRRTTMSARRAAASSRPSGARRVLPRT